MSESRREQWGMSGDESRRELWGYYYYYYYYYNYYYYYYYYNYYYYYYYYYYYGSIATLLEQSYSDCGFTNYWDFMHAVGHGFQDNLWLEGFPSGSAGTPYGWAWSYAASTYINVWGSGPDFDYHSDMGAWGFKHNAGAWGMIYIGSNVDCGGNYYSSGNEYYYYYYNYYYYNYYYYNYYNYYYYNYYYYAYYYYEYDYYYYYYYY